MFKRIIINLLLIVIVLGIAEFTSFIAIKNKNEFFIMKANKSGTDPIANEFKTKYKILEDFNPENFRKSIIKEDTKKNPIILFGCSFAEGAGLNDENTPCSKLSKLTGRSCINRSKGATGTQFIYYQLLNTDNNNEYKNADYIIYVFIWNHLHRLYNYQISPLIYMFNLRYKADKYGKLKEIKPKFKFIYSSFFIKSILNKKIFLDIDKEEKDFKLFNAMMKEIYRLSKEKYPNAKFIMLEFPETSHLELPENEIKTLNSYGIEVIKAREFLNNINYYERKYWLEDEIHPTSELWDFILPQLKEKYSM